MGYSVANRRSAPSREPDRFRSLGANGSALVLNVVGKLDPALPGISRSVAPSTVTEARGDDPAGARFANQRYALRLRAQRAGESAYPMVRGVGLRARGAIAAVHDVPRGTQHAPDRAKRTRTLPGTGGAVILGRR
jgi:hypothetical protein